jgi:hypothetical protein
LENSPNDLCLLPNNMIALSNSTQKNICVHDEDFNLIKLINKIDNDTFHPLRLETNNENLIYITEFSKCQVIMTDLNFNKIKSVGSMGSNFDQFNYPNGIALLDYFIMLFENVVIECLEKAIDGHLNINRVLVWSSNTIAELGASLNSLKEKLKDYIDEDITDLIIDKGNLNDKRLKNEKDQYYEDEMKR